jgi:hypothetical protein
MGIEISKLSKFWTLPSRVRREGQPHPYPGHLKVPFTRPEVFRNFATDESLTAIRNKWGTEGLGIEETRAKPVSLDVAFGRYTYSTEVDLALCNTALQAPDQSGRNLYFRSPHGDVNECIFLDTALVTGAITAEKIFNDDPSTPARLSSKFLIFNCPADGSPPYSIPFDWVNILYVHSLYEIARYSGKLFHYKGTYGQIVMAHDAGLVKLRHLHEAIVLLGLEKEMDHEPLDVSLKRIDKYIPDILKWAHANKISFYDAMKSFEYKTTPECREIFEKIKAACELSAAENGKVNNG